MTDQVGVPREGYFRVRLIRGGLFVGVRFWLEGTQWRVEVDGRQVRVVDDHIILLDALEVWPHCGETNEISEREFNFLARRRDWAREHAPDHPAAKPHQPVDLSKLPPRF